MKKLKHDVILTIPEEVQEYTKEHFDDDLPDKITIEIYHKEDIFRDGNDWEVYNINIIELEDSFDISINKMVMEIGRDIEEAGGDHIEEFIYHMVMKNIREEAEEQEARDFFEEISD